MKRTFCIACSILVFVFLPLGIFAQTQNLSGKITDQKTGEPLAYAKVIVKAAGTGVMADEKGNFEISLDFQGQETITLEVSFLSYKNAEIVVKKGQNSISIKMESLELMGSEVVITGSRVSESILESPVSIQKMTISDISNAASGDFYQNIGNLAGVDMVTSSIGFKSVNTRGFNSTSPVRSVQFIDGMDNQAPGLNFPVGNLVGASDLDLQSIELISGPASALYGPNAFQGVISMKTKDPYNYQGLSAIVRGGTRNQIEGHFRYASTIGKSEKFAFKLTGSYQRAKDWAATDPVANRYGDIEANVDMSAIVKQAQYDSTAYTPEELDDWEALNNYLDFNPLALPGKRDIQAPGYMEQNLANYNSQSLKLGAELHYKIKDSLEISYNFKFGRGTAVYQGTNRYSINNILFQQHKLELSGKRFNVKAYATMENAGDSYDVVFTAINISKEGIGEYVGDYLKEYFRVIDTLTNGFDGDARQWMVDSAHASAGLVASNSWYQPGTAAFDSLFTKITNDPDLQSGSKFIDRSNFIHLEGQYNLPIKWLDIITGANVRRYDPQSYGTIFRDTLINPGDTLANGQNDPKAKYQDISLWEFGGYVQLTKQFFKNRLKIIASGRVDKNMNFPVQLSPRLAVVYTLKNHTFRVAAQSAFRSPTLQNQYINLDLGPIRLEGNLNGWDNLYSLNSVNDFNDLYDSTYTIDPELLRSVTLKALKPEQIQSIEIGYRSVLWNKLYIDANAYFSMYRNFIGNIRVVRPLGGAVAGEESGVNALLTNNSSNPTTQAYQLPVNSESPVYSYGATLGLAYYIGKGFSATFNYTWSELDTSKVTDGDIIPGFNTPRHKFNIGITGRKVWKDLGFGINFKWVDKYRWESSFGDGDVPSYYMLDAQVSYEVEKVHSIFRIGGSNILNRRHIEAYGSPLVGGYAYASWTVDLESLRIKPKGE